MRQLAVLVLSLVSIAPAAQAPAPPDTILVNAHIVTVDARFSIAQAVAISGGRFTAVGTDSAISRLAAPPTTTIARGPDGELNGELIDRAKSLVELPPGPALTIESLVEQHKKLNAAGLTGIRYPGASIEQAPLKRCPAPGAPLGCRFTLRKSLRSE